MPLLPITLVPGNPFPLGSQQPGFGDVTSTVGAMFSAISFPVTSIIGTFNFYGTPAVSGSSTTFSSSFYAGDYNNFAFQASNTGSGTSTIFVLSSVDGLHFVNEFSYSLATVTSSIFRTSGRRQYIAATLSGSGTSTGSLYVACGQ